MSSTRTDDSSTRRAGTLRRVRDLRTGTKLLAAFLLMVALIVIVGSVGTLRLGETQGRPDRMYGESTYSIDLMGAVETNFEATRFRLVDLAVASDAESAQRISARIEELSQEISQGLDTYAGLYDDAQRDQNLEALRTTLREYQAVSDDQRDVAQGC